MFNFNYSLLHLTLSPSCISVILSPVAGLTVGKTFPLSEFTYSLLMKICQQRQCHITYCITMISIDLSHFTHCFDNTQKLLAVTDCRKHGTRAELHSDLCNFETALQLVNVNTNIWILDLICAHRSRFCWEHRSADNPEVEWTDLEETITSVPIETVGLLTLESRITSLVITIILGLDRVRDSF